MNCPFCNIQIELVKVNCGILRCGIYETRQGKIKQLPKHASEKTIMNLRNRIIFGCGNPIEYKNNILIKSSWDK